MSTIVRIALTAAALSVAACGSTSSSSSREAKAPSNTWVAPDAHRHHPTAKGGGPSTLHPDPTVDLGGSADDDMNTSPATEGVAPTQEQPTPAK